MKSISVGLFSLSVIWSMFCILLYINGMQVSQEETLRSIDQLNNMIGYNVFSKDAALGFDMFANYFIYGTIWFFPFIGLQGLAHYLKD